jgi:hypothetical protein
MTAYHVSRDGKTLGVYPESDARDYYAQGRIAPTDLLWREGMATWVAAGQVFGPAAQAASAVAPPVPPPMDAAPAPMAQAGAAQGGQPSVPLPPRLHWGLLLLFSVVTLGVVYVVWMFIQAVWVKKIDPRSNAIPLLIAYLVLAVIGQVIADGSEKGSGGATAGGLLVLAGTIASIVAAFSMRRSMLDHYNQVEPIGLRLSGALTLFFGALYLQYHMTRIAAWKQSGVLPLQ